MIGSQEDHIQYRINRSDKIFEDAKLLPENRIGSR